MTVNIALRRQVTQLAYYTEGNVPEAFMGVPETWTPTQTGEFQRYWDDIIEGSLAQKRKLRFIPGAIKYQPTREPVLKDEYDEWLARVVCYAFSISPTAFTKQVNRATAQTQKQSADEEGLAPLQLWVKDMIDRILVEDFNSPDLEFTWFDDTEADPQVLMTVNTGYVAAGIKTRNEVRAEIGLDPIPDGDEITITAGNTVTRLADALDPPEPPPMMQAGMPEQPQQQQPGEPGKAGPGGPQAPAKTTKRALGQGTDPDRKAVRQTRQRLEDVLTPFLADQAEQIASKVAGSVHKLRKDLDSDAAAADETGFHIDWSKLFDPVRSILDTLFKDSGVEALVEIGITDHKITEQVNADAVEFASTRAAQLVGKRWDGEKLIDNPNVKWAITKTTRDGLKALIETAETEGQSVEQLAKAIRESALFSSERAIDDRADRNQLC